MKYVIPILLIFTVMVASTYVFIKSGGWNSEKSPSAKYEEVIVFLENKNLQYPDFSLRYTGTTSLPLPNNSSVSMVKYNFEITAPNGSNQTIFWSSGTGDIGPQYFLVGEKNYQIELQYWEKEKKNLAQNEMVISVLQENPANPLSTNNIKFDIWQSLSVTVENNYILAHLTFRNTSKDAVYILNNIAEDKNLQSEAFIIEINGKRIDYVGPIKKRKPFGIADYRKLDPGQEWENTIDITKSYAFVPEKNEYTIIRNGYAYYSKNPDTDIPILVNTVETKFIFERYNWEETVSNLLDILMVINVEEQADSATITFHDGRKGKLKKTQENYEYYLRLANASLQGKQYVWVGFYNDSITQMGKSENNIPLAMMKSADNDFPTSMFEDKEHPERMKVLFESHNAIFFLFKNNPRFQELSEILKESIQKKSKVWFITGQWLEIMDVQRVLETQGTASSLDDISSKFNTLADQWEKHCQNVALSSNIKDYLNFPAYNQLVALGFPAIPYIMERYKNDNLLPWEFVLDDITGLHKIQDRENFNPQLLKKEWFDWLIEYSSKNNDTYPVCLKEKIQELSKDPCTTDMRGSSGGANIKEYWWKGKTVYALAGGSCGAVLVTEMVDVDCKNLGFLSDKIEDDRNFKTATFVENVWINNL